MFSIVITEKGGAQRQLDIESPELSIGRLEDNDICLPKSNVSKHHARLVFKDERYVLLDQKSTNGTYVNGRRISAPMVVRKGDKIYIGDFILTLAAPGGTFEGVSAREFRPRRPSSDAIAPPKQPSPTQDDMRAPSDGPVGAATQAALPSVPPPIPSAGGFETEVSFTAPGEASPDRPSSIPALPLGKNGSAAPARSVPPPLPGSASRVTVPPPTRVKAEAAAVVSRKSAEPAVGSSKSVPGWSSPDANPLQSGLTSPAVLAPSLRLQGALAMLMERLATEMNVARPEESAFPSEHSSTLERLIDELASEGAIGPDLDRRFLREAAISEAVGLGPLDRLLANRSVRELVVDGPTRILADLGGGLTTVSTFFSDDSAVLVIARRLLHRAGRKLDENVPVQEARLPSGGFLQLLLPPLAAKGPLITVRCPPRALSSPESLVTDGVLSGDMLAYLRTSVQQRKNILVLGAMGSGVSSVLGVLAMLAPDHERIVTIENAPSASLVNAQTLPLSRHAKPDLSLEDFLKYASRLRHDRLLIDDVGASDALAALSAAAANPGLLLGMHAPTPDIALLQLELFAQAALGGGRTSLAPLLATALQIVIHIATTPEGARRVQGIFEVRTNKGGALELSPRFRYDAKGFARA
ncbi:MAG TPA: ATPase, T2SS/T4P/T4SS family [Polyangiales bacterium]|nr:ATPase, T2SS/T4P/T4SS family [Polyangiales bacterium]